MSFISFPTVVGTTIAFNPVTDTLLFPVGSASGLQVSQSGDDTLISLNGSQVRLATVSASNLVDGNFSFADGSFVRMGTPGNDTLTGSAGADYFDISTGGVDSVSAGNGNDVIIAGNQLSASDQIDGGIGLDVLRLSGNFSVTMGANTATGVETLSIGEGAATIALANQTVTSATSAFSVDASAQSQGSFLSLDGSAVAAAGFFAFGGNGNDTLVGGGGSDGLTGGDGTDSLVGGGGIDTLRGGLGADTLVGGAGDDTFQFAFVSARTESAPNIPDVIQDFEGAGAPGGDIIDLPAFNLSSQPLAFNVLPSTFNFTGANSGSQPGANAADGFIDVFWKFDSANSRFEVWVDTNDDGQFSEVDLRIIVNPAAGSASQQLTIDDFAENFPVFRGTDAADTYLGNALANQVFALAGDDTLSGAGGNDTIAGGADNDTIDGGIGSDSLYGGTGNDSVQGLDGSDIVFGGAGNDTLLGGNDADQLLADNGLTGDGFDTAANVNLLDGGAGNDFLFGGLGQDTLIGGSDNDTLNASSGNDSLDGGDGSDNLSGGDGSDTLLGGAGLDTLFGSTGADSLTGGTEADQFSYTIAGTAESTLASMDTITDFSAAEGDKISLGSLGFVNGLPLAFRGNLGPIDVATGPQPGMSLPGNDIGDQFYQVWWIPATSAGAPAGGWLVVDTDRNFELNGADFTIRIGSLTNPVTITQSDFVTGTFTAQVGTPVADTITGANAGDLIYGAGGDDTLSGAGGNDTIAGGADNDTIDGGIGSDSLYGGTGNDSVQGLDGSDIVFGGAGNDTLLGGNDADQLLADNGLTGDGFDTAANVNLLDGGAGNDFLFGGLGQDTLIGGSDNDTLNASSGNDSLDGGDGSDNLSGGDGSDTLLGGAGLDTLFGSTGADSLTGGTEADQFSYTIAGTAESTLASMDTITDFSAAEGDKISLGSLGFVNGLPLAFRGNLGPIDAATGPQPGMSLPGNDIGDQFYQVWWIPATSAGAPAGGWLVVDTDRNFQLGASDFIVRVGSDTNPITITQSDFVTGTFTAQVGRPDADTITGASAGDLIYGVGGDDTLSGAGGNDTIAGGADNDTIDGGIGSDSLYGGTGNDSVQGLDGSDIVFGGAGNDTLLGGNDADQLLADNGLTGDGFDTAANVNLLDGGAGNDFLFGGLGQDTLIGGSDNDTLNASSGNDSLDGGDGSDNLSGGDGSDTLLGGAGLDTLFGSTGADSLTGGTEADQFSYTIAGTAESTLASMDTITDFSAAEGDKISLGSLGFVNGLPLAFRGNLGPIDAATGPQPGMSLPGNDIGDQFYQVWWIPATSAGAPAGGWLVVDTDRNFQLGASDFIVRVGSDTNPITITQSDFVTGTFTAQVGRPDADTITGASAGDLIYGVGGDDTLSGAGGNDTIAGGADNDTIDGGIGSDSLYGGTGNDSVQGLDGSDIVFGGAGNDTLLGGNDADQLLADNGLTGDGFDTAANVNLLDGGAGNDFLFGGLGQDTLIGGSDNDTLNASSGNDSLDGGDGSDNLSGGDGSDTLLGGAGLDTLSGSTGADSLTGGTEADQFSYTIAGTAESTLASMDTITDFSAAEGDKISLGSLGFVNGLPLAFRGNLGPIDAATGPQPGMSLPGNDIGDQFYQVWWIPATSAGAPAGGWLVVDTDRNFQLGASDFIVRVGSDTNPITITQSDFVTGTFTAQVGRPDADTITGASAGDLIYGVGGDDTLSGAGGNDTIAGGADNDTIDGGIGSDSLYGGTGNDSVQGLDGSDIVFGGAGNDTLLGGNDADQLLADNGLTGDGFDTAANVNLLDGGAGNDFLFGGLGQDTLIGGSDNDTLNASSGNDSLDGGDGSDNLSGGDGSDIINGGTNIDTISGGNGNDLITGGSGNDSIEGGTGIDIVVYQGNREDYVFTGTAGSFTISDGQASRDGVDTVLNVEFMSFANGTFATSDPLVPVTIISIDDIAVTEGDSGNQIATFTVTRSGNTGALSVDYTTADVTATAGSDYLATSGTLNFAAGVNSQTISVTVNGDTTFEPNETFFVNLSGATGGATIIDAEGLGTIVNNDPEPAGSITIGNVTVTEGDSGNQIATFTVGRSGGTAAFSVGYATADGTATAGSDYVATSGTLNFGTGVNSQTISVTVNGDTTFEPDETFFVNLSGAAGGATIVDAQGLGTILNNDPEPTSSITIGDVTVTEGDSGSQIATFTVTRSGGTAAFSVDYATADGTATAGSDYVATNGTLNFAAGVNSQTISITVNGDTTFEPNETFFVNLSGATAGATIADPQALGTITNNDPEPAGSITIGDVTVTEGDSGSQIVTFTVTRSGGTAALSVDYATADGTATAGSDYVATNGTLNFAAGVNSQTISVTVNGDTTFEPDETFFVDLSGATAGAIITDAQALGTITNNDPELVNQAPTITSNGGGASAAVSIAENTTAVTTATATDADAQALSFSIIAGLDGPQFHIDQITGALSFITAPDFENPTDADGNSTYDVTVQVSDGNGGIDSQVISVGVINVNEAPLALNRSALTLEDILAHQFAAESFGFADTQDVPPNQLQTIIVSSLPTHGTLTFNGQSVSTGQSIAASSIFISAPGRINYTPDRDFFGQDTFTYQVQDNGGTEFGGIDTSATPATMTITVLPINDAPVLDLNGVGAGTSATLNYTENQAPTPVAPSAIVSDIDSSNFDGGILNIGFTANGSAADQLTIDNQGTGPGQIGVSGNVVTYGGVPIGTFDGGVNGGNLVIFFTSPAATTAAVQELASHILYSNTSDNPSTLPRTLLFTMTDGDGNAFGGADVANAIATINVTTVNDAPIAPAINAVTTNEDTASALVAIGASDANGDTLTYSLKSGFAPAKGSVAFSGDNFTYTPNADINGTDAFTIVVSDGHGGTAEQAVSVSVNPVNDAPIVTGAPGKLLAIDEDTVNPVAQSIFSIVTTGVVNDARDVVPGGSSGDFLFGVAIVGNAEAGEGTWQYSDDGTTWTDVGVRSTSNALVVSVVDYIRFVPVADFNGPAPELRAHAIDGLGDGLATGMSVDLTGATGGTTHFSAGTFAIQETINPVNDAPTDIVLAASTVSENAPNTTVVGTLSASDPDAGDGALFSLLDDAGGRFAIVGNQLVVANGSLLDFEAATSHTVTVQATDTAGATYSEAMTISLQNIPGVTLTGTNAANTLTGTGEEDTLSGLAGNDLLQGVGGNDRLDGGGGTDTLDGGAGNDVLIGRAGNDSLNGGAGNDIFNYIIGDGADTVNGGGGAGEQDILVISGSTGSDTLDVIFNGTTLTAFENGALLNVAAVTADLVGGADTLHYGTTTVGVTVKLVDGTASGFASIAGIENITGGGSNDQLIGDALNNNLTGGAGNDTLIGGLGIDVLTGGAGTDTASYANEDAAMFVDLETGTTRRGSAAAAIEDTLATIENVIGGSGNDTMTGNASANSLDGGSGDDALLGAGGADVLNGGDGNDTLTGGAGNDVINGGLGSDTFVFIFGDGADNISGGADSDTLRIAGTAGNDTLDVLFNGTVLTQFEGGTLADMDVIDADLQGGTDTLTYVGTAVDVSIDLGGGSASGFASILGIERVTGGSGNDTLTGDGNANTLTGGAGNDILNGNGGTDVLVGGTGSDTYFTDGGDTLTEVGNAPADTDTVLSSVAFTLANNFENLVLMGSGDIDGIGNTANNLITGNDGNNILTGVAGADTLVGGIGNDVLVGGTGGDITTGGIGDDMFVFNALNESGIGIGNSDMITDFEGAGLVDGDTINLSALDANAGVGGDQAFTFIGTAAFSAAGQVRYSQVGGETIIQANTNAKTSTIEFELHLLGNHVLSGNEFIL